MFQRHREEEEEGDKCELAINRMRNRASDIGEARLASVFAEAKKNPRIGGGSGDENGGGKARPVDGSPSIVDMDPLFTPHLLFLPLTV